MQVQVSFSSWLDIATPVTFVSDRWKGAQLKNHCISKRALNASSTLENPDLIVNFMHSEI